MKFFRFCLLTILGSLQANLFPVQDILDMVERDNEVRKRWIETKNKQIAKELRFQEIGNTAYLKKILSLFGLPDAVEELGVPLIQLAVRSSDLEFQKDFLERATAQSEWSEMLDTLTDRVLLRQGLPQRFGTHLYHADEHLVPYPIENLEVVDERRQSVKEPLLSEYLEIMRGFDRAILENQNQDLYKIAFNTIYDFYQNPSEYLCYATFHPNDSPQKDEEGFLAFEDPSLAAAFALFLETPLTGDVSCENGVLLVTFSPKSVDDAVILSNTPLYMNFVKRDPFHTHKDYGPLFSNRVFAISENVFPVRQFECGSPIETLILGGSKIRIEGAGIEYEYQDTHLRDMIRIMFYFDITLENEPLL